MGIIREFNKGSMDDLRSLKNSDSGTKDSFIDKKEGFKYNQINARLTDVERFAKLLTSKPGLKFQGNQALLQQVDTINDLKKAAKKPGGGFNFKGLAKAVGKKALSTAVNNLSTTASILAQIPVNGTGTHFIRGLAPSGYLQSGAPRKTSLGQFLADQGIGGGINGAKSAKNGTPVGPIDGPLNANYVIDQPVSPNGLDDTSKNEFNGTIKFEENQFNSFLPPGAGTINQNQTNDYLEISGNPSNIVKGGNKITFLDNTGEEGWEGQSSKQRLPGEDRPATAPPPPSPSNAFTRFLDPAPSEEPATEQEDNTKTYLKKNGSNDPLLGHKTVQSVQRDLKENPDSNRKTKLFFDNLATAPKLPKSKDNENGFSFPLQGGEGKLKDKVTVLQKANTLKYIVSDGKDGKPYTESPIYIQTRYKLGDQGNSKNSGPDLVNAAIEQTTADNLGADLIPFHFAVLKGSTGNEGPSKTFIQFRAFLDGFSDEFNGNWSGTKYIGRAEEFYTYQGFDRNVSFNFKLAALSRKELTPLYRKLNLLAGTTAPTYNSDGFFMRGTLVTLKVGDYLDNVTGYISSLSTDWETTYPWETDVERLGTQKLPHILSISVNFKPIHDFNVKSDINLDDEVYIGRKTFPPSEEQKPVEVKDTETTKFISSGAIYTIDKNTGKVIEVNGQPVNYVNGGFAYETNNKQALITRVNGTNSTLDQ